MGKRNYHTISTASNSINSISSNHLNASSCNHKYQRIPQRSQTIITTKRRLINNNSSQTLQQRILHLTYHLRFISVLCPNRHHLRCRQRYKVHHHLNNRFSHTARAHQERLVQTARLIQIPKGIHSCLFWNSLLRTSIAKADRASSTISLAVHRNRIYFSLLSILLSLQIYWTGKKRAGNNRNRSSANTRYFTGKMNRHANASPLTFRQGLPLVALSRGLGLSDDSRPCPRHLITLSTTT